MKFTRSRTFTGLSSMIIAFAILAATLAASYTVPDDASAATGGQQRVVYLDSDNNVWSARTDGSDTQRLTEQGGFEFVTASPDGARILAVGPYPHESGTGVYLLSPEPDFGVRSLAAGNLPSWSPDGSKFAFHQHGAVHIFDRDGAYIRSAEAAAHILKWSPDGRWLGFARDLINPYGSTCPVRLFGWIDAWTGGVESAGALVGGLAWNADGTGLLHVSAGDGAIRSRSVAGGGYTVISNTRINPCGAPFFTTSDGRHLIGATWFGEPGADLIAINLQTGVERTFVDVPIYFPASRLPDVYISGDHTGRFVNLVRSFPTEIHRLDLETGAIHPILLGDSRRLIDISPDGTYFALLRTPPGQATELTIRSAGGDVRTIQNAGWMEWNTSPINRAAAFDWHRTWQREDRPVAAGASRTWLWGPEAFDVRIEEYDEGPDGFRAVRYYDKSRMEITQPTGNREDDWYVTNGLLVRELITGEMQVGDQRVVEQSPADVPVAGDEDDPNSPTYASLQNVLTAPATEPGQEITATIDRDGNVGAGGRGGVTAAHFVPESNHTVASVFWDYLNSSGPVWVGGGLTEGRLFQPTFFATGFPITEAYWATVRVAGVERDVLIQCFERRCLTYTPDNPEGWRVEMGNVGRHYHAWRHQ